ncbi:MAG TPA: CAP domain-containing protein, partial [Rugosimonospora sp.]|nr:CAP domain-containing protein [Rugosimonospora sp.]
GVGAAQRVTKAGYRWSIMGENIAEGQRTAADVTQAWMNSADHRTNILNCAFRNLGVGLAYDAHNTPFWTQDFAAPL